MKKTKKILAILLSLSLCITSILTIKSVSYAKTKSITLPNILEAVDKTYTSTQELSVGDTLTINVPIKKEYINGVGFYYDDTKYKSPVNFKNYFDMETEEAGSFDLYWKIKITAKKAMNLSDKGNYYINLLECHGTEVTHIIIYVKGDNNDNNDLKTIKLNAGLGIKDNKIYLKFATNVEGATWYAKLNDKKWQKNNVKGKTARYSPADGLKNGDKIKLQISKKGYKTLKKTITVNFSAKIENSN